MMEVDLYILHTSGVKEKRPYVLSVVDKQRALKASKYVHEKDQLLSLGAGYLSCKFLPKEQIKETKSGKPYLENGPFFNISHSGELVALAICESSNVGVDIERIDESKLDAIKFTLSEDEKDLNEINDLFRSWSNKESLLKCRVEPLVDVRKVSGLPLEGLRKFEDKEYQSKCTIYEGYSLSVTIEGSEPFNMSIKRVDISEN